MAIPDTSLLHLLVFAFSMRRMKTICSPQPTTRRESSNVNPVPRV